MKSISNLIHSLTFYFPSLFKIITPLFLLLFSINLSFSQVTELQNFRKAMTLFVQYDQGKIDSIPKSDSNTKRLNRNYERAFLDFVLHKNSNTLDTIKKYSIDNKTSHIIGNNNYFLSKLPRNILNRSEENNINFHVSFYGLYDYQMSNFVSFYIQPFSVHSNNYVVYYVKLNGKGTYHIKEVISNEIVFSSLAQTSNAAIKQIYQIDKNHLLIIEDMGDHGERALVVNNQNKIWKTVLGFSGNAFVNDPQDYTKKAAVSARTYLRFATSHTMQTLYGESFLKKYEISFDEKSKTISYKKHQQKESETKVISANWDGKQFRIDDYYLGSDLDDRPLPMPF